MTLGAEGVQPPVLRVTTGVPTDEELAAKVDLSVEDLRRARAAMAPLSLNRPTPLNDGTEAIAVDRRDAWLALVPSHNSDASSEASQKRYAPVTAGTR